MTDFTLEHEFSSDSGYVVMIDVPDHDLAATPLDTIVETVEVERPNPNHDPENPDSPETIPVAEPGPNNGKAVFRWSADPPNDPETGKPMMNRKDYEEMQQREAALLVKSAVHHDREGTTVKVALPSSLEDVE